MTDAALTFTTSPGKDADVVILKLSGPLTLGNMFGFQDQFRQMKPAFLLVDMSDVPYVDSAGLGVLVNGFVSAQDGHRRFALAGVTPRIQALMELTKVHTIIPVFENVEQAFEPRP